MRLWCRAPSSTRSPGRRHATLLVADRLQRDAIGVELNVEYTRMAMQRCRDDAPLFADIPPVPEHPVDTQIADLFAEAAE